ncbi:hypothetical protein WMF31_07625 [Sorangium sp. So ce1036]
MSAARERMGNYDYNGAISQGTGDLSKVELRIGVARELLRGAAG